MEVEMKTMSLFTSFLTGRNPHRTVSLNMTGTVQNGGGIYAEFELLTQTDRPTQLKFANAKIFDGVTNTRDAAIAVKKRLREFAAASDYIPQPLRQDILRAIGGSD